MSIAREEGEWIEMSRGERDRLKVLYGYSKENGRRRKRRGCCG